MASHLISSLKVVALLEGLLLLLVARPGLGQPPEVRPVDQPLLAANLQAFKQEYLSCWNVMDLWMDGQNMELAHELIQTIDSCEPVYLETMQSSLNDLGLVGAAINIWLEALNKFMLSEEQLHQQPLDLEQLLDSDVLYNQRLVDSLRARFHKPARRDYLADRDQMEPNLRALVDHLRNAFLFGDGLCLYTRIPPLFSQLENLATIWAVDRDTRDLINLRSQMVARMSESRTERGDWSQLMLMLVLANVCRRLEMEPFFQHLQEASILLPSLGLFGELTRQPCGYEQLFHSRRNHQGIVNWVALNDHDDENDLIANSRMSLNINHDRCLMGLSRDLWAAEVAIMPSQLGVYQLTKQLDWTLTNYDRAYANSLRDLLDLRRPDYLSDVELSLLSGKLNWMPLDEAGRDNRVVELFYGAGAGPICSQYESQRVYHEAGPLFRLMSYMDHLSAIGRYRPLFSNWLTTYYYTWKMCQNQRLIKLIGQPASASPLTTDQLVGLLRSLPSRHRTTTTTGH